MFLSPQKLEPPPQHAARYRLALVAQACGSLSVTINIENNVHLIITMSDESGVEFFIECLRHADGQRPAEHWKIQLASRLHCSLCRCRVVRMSRDPRRVKNHQSIHRALPHLAKNLRRQNPLHHVREQSVPVVEQYRRGDTQRVCGVAQFLRPQLTQISTVAQRGSFTLGETQHRHGRTLACESIEDGAQTKGLIVRVGDYRQH